MSLDRELQRLAGSIDAGATAKLRYRTGVIDSYTPGATTAAVVIGADTVQAPFLSTYIPGAGDTVAVLLNSASPVILGAVNAVPPGPGLPNWTDNELSSPVSLPGGVWTDAVTLDLFPGVWFVSGGISIEGGTVDDLATVSLDVSDPTTGVLTGAAVAQVAVPQGPGSTNPLGHAALSGLASIFADSATARIRVKPSAEDMSASASGMREGIADATGISAIQIATG